MKHFILPFIVSIACIGCRPDSKVIIDRIDLSAGEIIIDKENTYQFKDSVITLELSQGRHTIQYDTDSTFEFTVGKEGGMLNLDNQEYVAVQIEYAGPGQLEPIGAYSGQKAMILIEPYIIIPRSPRSAQPSDSLVNVYLSELLSSKNGNYLRGMGKSFDYDESEAVFGIRKFGRDKKFIKKFWDYGVGEEIPETLQIQTSSDSPSFMNTRVKVAVMNASFFLLLAQLSPEEYFVIDVTELNASPEDEPNE